jgi:hypothetical protein
MLKISVNGVIRTILIAFTVFMILGCQSGKMVIKEVHYYAVPNEDSTNYFRLTLLADSALGVAQFRSGWFPERAVDALVGKVELDKGAKELEVEEQLRGIVDAAIVKTFTQCVNEASKEQPDFKKLRTICEGTQRVREYPFSNKKSVTMEYNPGQNLQVTHANDKLIFLLASNPDEIISKISSFAEDEKTIQSISQLAQVINQKNLEELQNQKIKDELENRQVRTLSDRLGEVATTLNTMTLPDTQRSINELLAIINSI